MRSMRSRPIGGRPLPAFGTPFDQRTQLCHAHPSISTEKSRGVLPCGRLEVPVAERIAAAIDMPSRGKRFVGQTNAADRSLFQSCPNSFEMRLNAFAQDIF